MSGIRKDGDLMTYLGVPLFIRAPKRRWLIPWANIIKSKLESGKGFSLSMTGPFLSDIWLGYPLIDLVEDRSSLQSPLDSVMGDIYSDAVGLNIPTSFKVFYPDVAYEIENVVVSTDPNSLVWTCSLDGSVSCKSAYTFISEVRSSVFWGKQIWVSFIPHSRYVLIWRLFHGKIPTDIALRARGGKIVFVDALSLLWRSVCEADSLQPGTMKNSVDELQILQQLHVSGHSPKAPRILEGNWHPPPSGCLKVNTYGAAFGSPGLVGCAGVFRTCRGFVKCCFAIHLGVYFAFEAELADVVYAIDYAQTFGWHQLWLESDSTFVVDILRSRSRKVPWRWRSAWDRCLGLISQMDFVVTHIYREGNQTADSLASMSPIIVSPTWWWNAPNFCNPFIFNDFCSRPSFRLC
ncbi:hypothetical protein Ddye_007659 [Dipteronia dyeriana]|uniref:RNase H type-1 domain-containing protein n=1 Tax=Dipteronia dyeriana TaxID=168575 RepID=A0AAD9XK80_9ROSI|nr:hypothetical protein Ddye_007659 [Dipteronia dyeriana]